MRTKTELDERCTECFSALSIEGIKKKRKEKKAFFFFFSFFKSVTCESLDSTAINYDLPKKTSVKIASLIVPNLNGARMNQPVIRQLSIYCPWWNLWVSWLLQRERCTQTAAPQFNSVIWNSIPQGPSHLTVAINDQHFWQATLLSAE